MSHLNKIMDSIECMILFMYVAQTQALNQTDQ